MQRVVGEQTHDQFADILAEGFGAAAAPDRDAHEERDPLRRVVIVVGVPARAARARS
jgi:hypothetical protein